MAVAGLWTGACAVRRARLDAEARERLFQRGLAARAVSSALADVAPPIRFFPELFISCSWSLRCRDIRATLCQGTAARDSREAAP